jgi:hypothetical protein
MLQSVRAGRMEVHVGGVPISADGFVLAVTAPQQCELAWLPSELSAVVAGEPAFALLETRDAAGNRPSHVRQKDFAQAFALLLCRWNG